MLEIHIKTIPHNLQRYPTVGDWWWDLSQMEKNQGAIFLEVRVSDMGNAYYEYLVADHEVREAMLCLHRGIPEDDITKFDKIYESKRAAGNPEFQAEPGDHPTAPYKKEHFFATNIERLTAAELDIDWGEYDEVVESL